jgi:hypothetical protein
VSGRPRGSAFYARTGSRAAELWTLLHPPYTLWNLSYVAIGAALAPRLDGVRLALVLAAFLAGTGVSSHALDELNGRPLRTSLSEACLKRLALAGFAAAFLAALALAWVGSPWMLAWAAAGAVLVAAYSLEWWGGIVHSDLGFALAWGAFPVLAGYWSQAGGLSPAALLAAGGATFLSLAQRSLSTAARFARRRVRDGAAVFDTDAGEVRWEHETLLATWESPLRRLAWTIAALAAGLVLARL